MDLLQKIYLWLLKKKGWEVIGVSRTPSQNCLTWDSIRQSQHSDIVQFDAVLNFSGQRIFQPLKYITSSQEEYWNHMNDSRSERNLDLIEYMNKMPMPCPKVWITSSAVGLYPLDNPNINYDENFYLQNERNLTNLQQLVVNMEKSSLISQNLHKLHSIRNVNLRFGVVLANNDGFLPSIYKLHKMGLGYLGIGNNPFSWVHIDDVVQILLNAIENEQYKGAINVVSPCSHQNQLKDLSNIFVQTYKYKQYIPQKLYSNDKIPLIIKRFIGQDLSDLLFSGSKVLPKKLLDLQYKFKYPELINAVNQLFPINSF